MPKPNGPAPSVIADFPSAKHWQRLEDKGFNGRVTDEDLWAYHAYDYAWRRVALHSVQDHSPIDPERKWFNAKLVAEAEGAGSRSKPRVESWRMRVAAAYRWAYQRREVMPSGIPESDPRVQHLVQRYDDWHETEFAEQNRQLAAAKARIIGNGKNPDRTNSAEAIAYVELCSRIAGDNLRTFAERGQWMKRMPDGSRMPNADSAKDDLREDELKELANLRDKLGVKATEQMQRGFE
jgi:hypothetical protein